MNHPEGGENRSKTTEAVPNKAWGWLGIGLIAVALTSPPYEKAQEHSEPRTLTISDVFDKLKPLEIRADYVEAGESRGVDCQQSYPHTLFEEKFYQIDDAENKMHIGGQYAPDFYVLGEEAAESYAGYLNFAHGWVIRYDRAIDLYWVYKFDDTITDGVETFPGEFETVKYMSAEPISFFSKSQAREGLSYSDGQTTIYVGVEPEDKQRDWPLVFSVACPEAATT